MADYNFTRYKLDNGLVVAMQNTPTETISGALIVHFGAYHEKSNERGFAHFLEHCFASGDSRDFNQKQADRFVSSLGYSNAFTRSDNTSYLGRMLPEDFEEWLHYTSDVLFNPLFNEPRVNEERARVLREIADKKSTPKFREQRQFDDAIYRGHPKDIFVLGDESIVSSAKIEQLKAFHSRGYHPNNMELILAGALPASTTDLIKKYFGNQKPGENTKVKFPMLAPLEKKTIMHLSAPNLLNKENPQESSAKIWLAFVTVPDGHPDISATRLMNHMLSGSSNSRLYNRLSLAKGSAYSICGSTEGYYNCGVAITSATVHATRLEESLDVIFEEIRLLREKGVSNEELEAGKKISRYLAAESLDSNQGHISAMANFLDNGSTPDSLLKGYESVTKDKILEVARKYLHEDRKSGKYVLAIKDPLKG